MRLAATTRPSLRDAQQVDAINSVLEIEWQKKQNRELTEEVMRAVSVG